jgi:hypothetical protein
LAAFVCSGIVCVAAFAADQQKVSTQDFSSDPKWDALNNRLVPDPAPVTRQHFGWSATNHAGGKSKGEIGGRVQRSATPATYAMPSGPRTLKDKLHASGKFSVTQDDGGSGVLFGWFNHESSRGWRTPNSLGFRIDGNGSRGAWLFYEYGTQGYLAGGGGAFEGRRYQTTRTEPTKPDGKAHVWSLDYDPADNGTIRFVIDGKKYEVSLNPGHKADGAVFDRFGIWNVQTTGGGMDVWYDDLEVDGKTFDFSSDPKWEAKGNDVEFADRVRRPLQDFGFSPTNHAGGKSPGEMGGVIWRDDKPAYYAAKTEPLTLDDELFASGTVSFNGQGSDSGVWLGWFNSASKKARTGVESKFPPTDLLGIIIEGPSRIGHYFRQGYRAGNGEGNIAETGPVIHPDGKPHKWSMHYDPKAGEAGRIDLTFDDQKLSVDVRLKDRKAGAKFDRFGLFNVQEGGHYVEVYVDDLTFTARK